MAADHELASGRRRNPAQAQCGRCGNCHRARTRVVQPAGSGLGGGGFLLVRKADGTVTALDFREVAPNKPAGDMFLDAATGSSGARAIPLGWPGRRCSRRARRPCARTARVGDIQARTVIAPALRLADKGFPVGSTWHAVPRWWYRSWPTIIRCAAFGTARQDSHRRTDRASPRAGRNAAHPRTRRFLAFTRPRRARLATISSPRTGRPADF